MRIITEAHAEALVTMPNTISPGHNVSEIEIEQAIRSGIERYFDDCRARVPAFIDRHFHYPGAMATNRMALGWDMLRAPINLLWAPVYALVCLLKILVPKRTGLMWLHGVANRVPAGFNTRVQQYISHLILVDLLNDGQECSILESYLIEALEAVYERHTSKLVDHQRFSQLTEPLVADALSQYRVTRTASADITNSISCTVLGAFAFQKFTPGGVCSFFRRYIRPGSGGGRFASSAPAQTNGSPAARRYPQLPKQLSPERPVCGADSGHVRHDKIWFTLVNGVSAS